ncbi:MAG: polysaccharide pyruvyl transferase family protein [Campylobacter sp.]|nr:polysaccharide pyruvyl transferase family protein [Campylobacter sp.]
MKIAIFTIPLHNNYGGILQGYALNYYLNSKGFDAYTLNFKIAKNSKLSLAYLRFLAAKIVKFNKYKGVKFSNIQETSCKEFIQQNIKLTREIHSSMELKEVFKEEKFDACIVGSDQVFRPEYLGEWKDDFSLGFVGDECIKLSYAASFGRSEFRGENLELHRENLAKFRAVLVREIGAVKICKDLFSIKATHVLDPTLLVDKSVFECVRDESFLKSRGKILAYILDKTPEKSEKLAQISAKFGKEILEINDTENRVGVGEWISAFKEADMVITDSFHGCVFSIIFEKEFYCFINENRGTDRFYSLFEMFDLEDRILGEKENFKSIDYEKVSKNLNNMREKSINFLTLNLKKYKNEI